MPNQNEGSSLGEPRQKPSDIPRWSLGPALVTLLVAAALLPALLVIALLNASASDSIHALAESTMRQAVRRLEQGTLNHLGQAHTMLNGVLDTDATASPNQAQDGHAWFDNHADFERLAFALTSQTSDVPYVYIGATDGSFLGVEQEANGHVVRTIGPNDPARRQYLADYPGDRGQLLRVETKRYDPRARPWYKLAVKRGTRVFTDVYRSAVKSQFDLTLAQPVYRQDTGDLIGVVATDLSLAHLDDLVQATRISEHAVTYLVDSQGLLVASSTGETLTVEQDGQQVRLSPDGSRSEVIRNSWVQLAKSPAGMADDLHDLKNSKSARASWFDTLDWFNWLGTQDSRLLALKLPFGSEYGLKWQLVVVAPELDFTRQVVSARRWSLLALAAVLIASSLLTLMIARGLSRQFLRLNDAARALGEGLVPNIIRKTPFREVHALSSAMHHSASQLQRATEEIRRKNEALRQAAQTLEKRINERTQELSASRAEALEAARAKAGFLAVMSHEIRTPLNGVLGMSELLSHTAMNPSQAEMLSVVRTSGQQLLSVVNEILDFSKVEAGKLELDPLPFDLHDCLHDVQRMVLLAANQKGISLQVDVDRALPRWVLGDATRLRQVLLNLLNNGVKFTDRGSVTLSASTDGTSTEADGHARIRFAVEDTGIGIRAESIGKLFQPFQQSEKSISRQYGGTGLGLAISQHLVQLMGGQLRIESIPGRGSCFEFTIDLPLAEAPSSDLEAHHTATDTDLGAARVLVVDDNAVNRQVATAMLHKLGHECAEASDGREALEMVGAALESGQGFTHVLMDRQMQDMDGLQATVAIRQRWGAQAPRIIGLSASSLGEDEQACLTAGMEAYLPKPVTLNVLANALRGQWQPTSTLHTLASTPASDTDSSLPWLDPSRLDDFADFDDEQGSLRREVLGDFVRMLPSHLHRIEQALSEEVLSPAEVAKAFHGLRGSADNVGARRLGARSATLEVMAAAGRLQPRHLQELAELVETTAGMVRQAIEG